MEKYKVYIFDIDGTICEPFGTKLLPNVKEWFEANGRLLGAVGFDLFWC